MKGMSRVMCRKTPLLLLLSDKFVELVGGGSVINGALHRLVLVLAVLRGICCLRHCVCCWQWCLQEGEKLYKMIGNLPDKDMAILEERIKRVTKTSQVHIDPCMGSRAFIRVQISDFFLYFEPMHWNGTILVGFFLAGSTLRLWPSSQS